MKQLIRKSLPFYLYPASNCHLKVNDRTRCEICSKITLKTPELHQWRRSGVFIVNFEHVIVGWVKIKGVYLLQTKQVELTENKKVEPIQPVQTNIVEKNFHSIHFNNEPSFTRTTTCRTIVLHTRLRSLSNISK